MVQWYHIEVTVDVAVEAIPEGLLEILTLYCLESNSSPLKGCLWNRYEFYITIARTVL
jgi:hypothetical protein